MQLRSKIILIIYFSIIFIGLIILLIYLSLVKQKTVFNEFDGFPDEGNPIVKFDQLAMNNLLISANIILGLAEIRKILESSPKKDMEINKILLDSINPNKRTCFTKEQFHKIEEIIFPKADYANNTDYFPYNFTIIFLNSQMHLLLLKRHQKIKFMTKQIHFLYKQK